MTSPTRIIWTLAERPEPDKTGSLDPQPCRMCALPTDHGQEFDRWQGSSFTDQNKVKCTLSHVICTPCIWAHSWVQPPGLPPAPKGKRGLNLRLFSHFYDDRGYHYWNKGNKAEMRDWLRSEKRGPWFACIADTGQKHVLPYTQMNPAGSVRGVIRFEERDVIVSDWRLLDDATELLTDGVTKESVESGDYSPQQWMDSTDLVRDFEQKWGRYRGSGWFDLCLWLAQRDEDEWKARRDERKRQRKAAAAHSRGHTRTSASVSSERSKPPQALGATARPCEDGGQDLGKRGGLGDQRKPQPRPRQPEQLSLFGD